MDCYLDPGFALGAFFITVLLMAGAAFVGYAVGRRMDP